MAPWQAISLSEDRPEADGSPRGRGWRPRNWISDRLRGTGETFEPGTPKQPAAERVPIRAAPSEGRAPVTADPRQGRASRPPREEYTPFVPRARREMTAMIGGDVTGDVILAGDESSTDLAAISAARLGGRAIALSGLVVIVGVVLSRLLGEVRLAVIGAVFGAGANLDAFTAAFRIPDTLFQLVAAGAIGS